MLRQSPSIYFYRPKRAKCSAEVRPSYQIESFPSFASALSFPRLSTSLFITILSHCSSSVVRLLVLPAQRTSVSWSDHISSCLVQLPPSSDIPPVSAHVGFLLRRFFHYDTSTLSLLPPLGSHKDATMYPNQSRVRPKSPTLNRPSRPTRKNSSMRPATFHRRCSPQ